MEVGVLQAESLVPYVQSFRDQLLLVMRACGGLPCCSSTNIKKWRPETVIQEISLIHVYRMRRV